MFRCQSYTNTIGVSYSSFYNTGNPIEQTWVLVIETQLPKGLLLIEPLATIHTTYNETDNHFVLSADTFIL